MVHTLDRLPAWTVLLLVFSLSLAIPVPRVCAQASVSYEPDREELRDIVLENDVVRYVLHLDKTLKLIEVYDKELGVDLLGDQKPLQMVSVRKQLWLDDVGYQLFHVKEEETDEAVRIELDQRSSYVENPLHVVQRFELGARRTLRWNVHVTNTATGGRAYRDPLTIRSDVRFPVMQEFAPGPEAGRDYLLPEGGNFYFLNDPDDFIYYFSPSTLSSKTTGGPSDTFTGETFPVDISSAKLDRGAYFYVFATPFDWAFESPEDFSSRQFELVQEPGDTTQIMDVRIGPHEGDWHAAYRAFRDHIRSQFDFTFYERPIQESYRKKFISHFTFLYGKDIYDFEENRFDVERFLEEGEKNFGGYDYMLLWHDYPRMGIDPRDQFMMYEDLPGGLDGVRDMVSRAHENGVQVFIPYKPWDIMQGRSEKEMFGQEARIADAINADGVFLDTMDESELAFRDSLDAVNPDNVFVSEGRPTLEAAELVTGSWNQQGTASNEMPNVDLFRFVLPEHNVHNINRGARRRVELIYNSLFNGTGFIVWEDIFGEINRYSWQERVMIKRYNRIVHENSDAYLTDDPIPLVEDFREDLYVNAFPSEEKVVYPAYQTGRPEVSRSRDDRLIGAFMPVDHPDDWHYVDLWNHRKIPARQHGDETWLYFPEEPTVSMSCIVGLPRNLEVEHSGSTLSVSARNPLEGARIEFKTVDNLTKLEEEMGTVEGNEAELDLDDYEIDTPYKVLVKLMVDEVMRDQVIVNLGWKQFELETDSP